MYIFALGGKLTEATLNDSSFTFPSALLDIHYLRHNN